ncbi:MAG: MFS transporter [Akkermansiaceae bacterium]
MNTTTIETNKKVFWGCFIALVATGFGFIARMFLINTWAAEFNLDPAQAGRLAGIGIWPFAVSIILFSLFIDRIGYKVAMLVAFIGHMVWAIMGVSAYFISKAGNPELGFQLVFWGSLILALGNGSVEAFINPVVATLYSKEKTKWLNILHAGWPGGLVFAGLIAIFIDHVPWFIKVGVIAVPAVVYFIMLVGVTFPKSERESAGVGYREMLREFGILGASIFSFLMTLQLMDFFPNVNDMVFIALGIAMVVAFGIYTQRLGRGILFLLILIMLPLATTEIGTDGWITGIMEGVVSFHPGWVLVYTSTIMCILRFYAGPIVHKLSPLGLLCLSSALAVLGLTWLSGATGVVMIFAAATLYALGKTFFWPTMLGVASEQTPKGGALTLNAVSGIGMLAVGTLGFPYIGVLQTNEQQDALAKSAQIVEKIPRLVVDGEFTALTNKKIYEILEYKAIDDAKVSSMIKGLPLGEQAEAAELVKMTKEHSNQKALGKMAVFPAVMFVSFLALLLFFKSRGGYSAVDITADQ